MKKISFVIVLTAFFVMLSASAVVASTRMPENIMMKVDDSEASVVKAVNAAYDNNKYISLRDIAVLFAHSGHPFNLEISGSSVSITEGAVYEDEDEHSGWAADELRQTPGGDPGSSALSVNGDDRRYYTFLIQTGDQLDCFISPMDLGMILDVGLDMDEKGNITVDTSERFDINPARMEEDGFFDGVNTVVVGDATTGEVFYGYDMEKPFPIASTTKLMTVLLTMDAIAGGDLKAGDSVKISQGAALLAASSDGTVPMKAGALIPVSELVLGALLPSSNECALALAEHIGGSEAAFAEMMNEKAATLGLDSARFYNCNGLPVFSEEVITSKTQNKMSGYDMFRMCSHILNTYPEIKDITSLKTSRLATLGKEIKNTNGLLYNMPEVNGLKTGTTTRSGACLITSLTVGAPDSPHDLVVVLLGAENSQARIRVSELLARYGKAVIEGNAARVSYSFNIGDEEDSTVTAEKIVRMVVDLAIRK